MDHFWNKNWSRREFLKTASAATLSTLAAYPQLSWGKTASAPIKPTADAVILLWMAGGMAHTETFDPKFAPKQYKGTRSYTIQSTFQPIPTAIDGVHFSSGLEQIASVMDRGTVIRSFSPPDLGHILHSRHQYHWHTGYVPPQTIETPHIGSMVVKTLGPKDPDIPPFVHIGQRLDIDGAPEVQAFLTAGFLGGEYAPLLLPYPDRAMQAMSPPEGMTLSRFQNRYEFFKKLQKNTPTGEFGNDYQRESLMRSLENGYRLLNSPKVKAFDLKEEPEQIYNTYNTSRFGLGCLLARRLIEAGSRFVEVSTEHVPFGNWDTHTNGHARTVEMKRWVDAPIAQLIRELDERGLLERTTVIVASEFSRCSIKNASEIDKGNERRVIHQMKDFGLHRHFTKAGCMLAFGGGFRRGAVYGKTADEVPCETIENPVSVMDFHATMYRTLGIPADLSYDIENRPFYATQDGKGQAVLELLA